MILSLGSLYLASDIDDLGLIIPSNALVKIINTKFSLSSADPTTFLTWSIPSTFTGDCVISFRVLAAAYGQALGSDNECTGVRMYGIGTRIGSTLTAGSVTETYTVNESTAPSSLLAVSGSNFLLRIDQNTTNTHTWSATTEIFGVKI